MGNYRAVNTHTHARIVQVFIGNAVRSFYLSSLRDSLKFHVQNGCMPLCFSSNFFFSHVAKRPDHLYVTFFSRSLPLSLFVSLNDDQLVPYLSIDGTIIFRSYQSYVQPQVLNLSQLF